MLSPQVVARVPFIIHANNKDYMVSDHAAKRMRERFISEELIIETLENGTVFTQAHGIDLYEHEIYDIYLEAMIIVRVAVDEENRVIVSVIDDTDLD